METEVVAAMISLCPTARAMLGVLVMLGIILSAGLFGASVLLKRDQAWGSRLRRLAVILGVFAVIVLIVYVAVPVLVSALLEVPIENTPCFEPYLPDYYEGQAHCYQKEEGERCERLIT